MRKRVLLLLSLCTYTFTARADYRYYAWTYQYMTMLPGRVELEYYNTMIQSNTAQDTTITWKRQTEIEAGLTGNWDVSVYMVNSYKPSDGNVKYDELKFRTRYKLSAKDRYFIDPLAYVEYKYQIDRSYPDKLETKLVLAKDIDNVNIALNIIPEEYFKTGTKEKGWKTEYAFGASYQVVDKLFRMGVEAQGDFDFDKHSAGPSFALKGKQIWAAVSPLFALNEKADDLKVQMIVGILF